MRRARRPRRAAREPLLALRDREALRRGVPARLEPHPRHARTSSRGSATSSGRGRRASLEGGVVSIFLDRLARGDETVIFGDGAADARLRLRRRRRRGAARGASAHEGGVVQRRHRRRDDGARAPPGVRRGRGRRRRAARSSRRGSATCAARCSTSRAPPPSSASGAQTPLAEGLARTWAWTKRPSSRRSPRGTRRNREPRGRPAAHARTSWSGRGAARPSSRARSRRSSSRCSWSPPARASLAKPLSHVIRTQAAHAVAAQAAVPRRPGRSSRRSSAQTAPAGQGPPARPRADHGPERQRPVGRGRHRGRHGCSSLGYKIAGTANAHRQDYATSVVMYRPGFRAEGIRLAQGPRREGRRAARRHPPRLRCTAASSPSSSAPSSPSQHFGVPEFTSFSVQRVVVVVGRVASRRDRRAVEGRVAPRAGSRASTSWK